MVKQGGETDRGGACAERQWALSVSEGKNPESVYYYIQISEDEGLARVFERCFSFVQILTVGLDSQLILIS